MSSPFEDRPSSASPARVRRGRGPATKRNVFLLAILVLAGVGIGIARFELGTYHLATVDPGILYRDGARSAHELTRAVRKVHARTVVSLIDDEELADPSKPQFAAEERLLKQQGVRADRIPVKLGGLPTTDDVRKFLAVVQDPAARPVLLHCAQGVRRTAMLVAAYQESVLGFDKTKAKDAIISFGHSDKTINDIRRFIDLYDPVSRTVLPATTTAPAPAS